MEREIAEKEGQGRVVTLVGDNFFFRYTFFIQQTASGFQMCTYEEGNSDIGTRKTGNKRARGPMVNVPGTSNGLWVLGMC